MRGLYAILDNGALRKRDAVRVAKSLIASGVGAIQYRAKGVGDRELFHTAHRLARLCRSKKIPFIVNDRCDIALAVDAAGVHLGSEDLPYCAARKILGPKKIIGVSSHSVAEALQKGRLNPDYVSLGPIFKSKTKPTRQRLLGLTAVRRVTARICCPVVAIGGIDSKNAGKVVRAGASAVAVVRSVLASRNPGRAAKLLVEEINPTQTVGG